MMRYTVNSFFRICFKISLYLKKFEYECTKLIIKLNAMHFSVSKQGRKIKDLTLLKNTKINKI